MKKISLSIGNGPDFILIYHENICCVYPLEWPHGGSSNEYTQQYIIL